jgi:endonuclease/exonuclease/phosphatase family metal-dependent hydrolase
MTPFAGGNPDNMSPLRHKKLKLRLVTYNVHKCRGLDGRVDTERIAKVLKPLKADVIALQEIVGPSPKLPGQEEDLALRLQMVPIFAPARSHRGHLYGNAMLSRLPVTRHMICDLSVSGHESRLCQKIEISLEGHTINLYNVHLGTSDAERARQAKKLASRLADESVRGPKILIGDFNEWKKGRATDYLCEKLNSIDLAPYLGWRKTYPGLLPIFHLDHLYYSGNVNIVSVHVPRGLRTLIASDHLPMLVELQITVKI